MIIHSKLELLKNVCPIDFLCIFLLYSVGWVEKYMSVNNIHLCIAKSSDISLSTKWCQISPETWEEERERERIMSYIYNGVKSLS